MDFQSVPLWDIPDSYTNVTDEDFLALLSKEFPIQPTYSLPPTALADTANLDPDGINPASLTNFPVPVPGHATPPLTDDSSPSPPASSNDVSQSRRQSGAYPSDQDGLKRKASHDDFDDDASGRKNPGDSSKKSITSASRSMRKPGSTVTHKDEIRLARRKEQNRAAQRAFRERKEKHVKDLEDRVAELEDAQRAKESENENLRDLLHRLQEENQSLKQQQFTFQVPHNGNGTQTPQHPQSQQQQQPMQQSAGPSTSQYPTSPPGAQQPPAAPQPPPPAEIDWNSLTTFDPAALSMLDEPQDVTMDFAGPPANGRSPYKTIAANPMFMSFAEPFAAWDGQLPSGAATHAAGSPDGAPAFPAFNSFGSWAGAGVPGWTPPHSQGAGGSMGSLDDLFGMNGGAGLDFTQSPPVAPSLAHAHSSSSASSSISSPNFASYGAVGHSPNSLMSSPSSTDLSSPPSSTGSPSVEQQHHSSSSCPRTKAEFAARIADEIKSPFTTASPSASAAPSPAASTPGNSIKKTRDSVSGGAQITCAGSVFPQTEKSPMNVEVLAAWRDITSDPKFKDVDINELCAEFTNKAKCDGTKVVLDRQGVEEIKNKFSGRI